MSHKDSGGLGVWPHTICGAVEYSAIALPYDLLLTTMHSYMYLYNYNNFNAMFEIQEQLKKQTKTLQANKAAVIFFVL